MTVTANAADPDLLLRQLAAKYAVELPKAWRLARIASPGASSPGTLTLAAGWSLLGIDDDRFEPLLPWRSERRFAELRRLVEGRTVEPVAMCRFSCLAVTGSMPLDAVLYREFDLVQWIVGSPITTLYASIAADRSANVLVRLANDVLCSVEAGVTLPAGGGGPPLLDRHELIAGRGVASDRVVDTQVPQSSIYTYTGQGRREYTDTDAELYGLEIDDVNLVRAAYELAVRPELAPVVREEHRRLARLVKLARESDRARQRMVVEGGKS